MKKELRKEFLSERNSLSEHYRILASEKIFSTLEKHNTFITAEKRFIYFLLASIQKYNPNYL